MRLFTTYLVAVGIAALSISALMPAGGVASTNRHGAAADAPAVHAAKWYWTTTKAQRRLKQRFSDVRSASCIGFGYDWRVRKGREEYRAFYCSGRLIRGGSYEVTLYPRGRRAFRVDGY